MEVKITIGKNGRKYYFYKGKRISAKVAKEFIQKSKSRRKSSKKEKSGKCEGVKCPKDKICNHDSGRCVKRTGRIGKKITR